MKTIIFFCIILFWGLNVFGQKVASSDCEDPPANEKKRLKVLIRKSLDDEDMKEKSAAFSATFNNGQSGIYQVDAAIGFDFRKDKHAFEGLPIIEWHRNSGIEKPQNALLIGSNFNWELTKQKRLDAMQSLGKSVILHKLQITPRYAFDAIEKLRAIEVSAFWSPKRLVGQDTINLTETIVRDAKTNKKLKSVSGGDSVIVSFGLDSKFFQPNAEHQFWKSSNPCKGHAFSSYWSPQAGIEYQNRFQSDNQKAEALGVLAMLVFKINWSLKFINISKPGVTRPIAELTLEYQNRIADLANTTKTIKAGMKDFFVIGLDYVLLDDKITKTSIGISYTKGQDPTKFLAEQDFYQLGFKVKLN